MSFEPVRAAFDELRAAHDAIHDAINDLTEGRPDITDLLAAMLAAQHAQAMALHALATYIRDRDGIPAPEEQP